MYMEQVAMDSCALWICDRCLKTYLMYEPEDHTDRSGGCGKCGSIQWGIYNSNITKQEYFKSKLSGKYLNIAILERIG